MNYDERSLIQTLEHVAALVAELRQRPEIIRHFADRKLTMPSAPGDFIRAYMPSFLPDMQVIRLLDELPSASAVIAARDLLVRPRVSPAPVHRVLADRYREIEVYA